ncbi:MAG: hypothetical protein GC193_14615 [Cryomorphaceae bacterium]|nr:hypothetical protein [Cryomorphaceae bacterium]
MNMLVLASTAVLLGIRHGVEWDHVAAIMDIVSAAPETTPPEPVLLSNEQAWPQRFICDLKGSKAMRLACLYAVGHALIVAVLGLVAISFSVLLPEWINPIMEKIVGATLLFFGFYVAYSLWLYCSGKQKFRMRSRWMLVIQAISRLLSKQKRECSHDEPQPGCCGPRSALGLGMLHGFGAETGTQVLLLSTISGASKADVGVLLLTCFIMGMFVSNTIVAAVLTSGALASRFAMPINAGIGAATACFSIWVGILLIT